jgi:hypothetical protein
MDESRKYLKLNYNTDLLLDLSQSIKDSLFGPVGKFYWEQRKDEIKCYVEIIFEKFVLPVQKSIENFLDLRIQKEI